MPILSRKNAILTTTEKIVSINGLDLPATVVFKSTNIGAAIAISGDGVEFFPATLINSSGTQKVATIITPMESVRVTGSIGDEIIIL